MRAEARAISDSAKPRIAVVVPCYNDGETLTETLDSLEEQEPLEIVVVNDGSTDERTLEVLDRLSARGVRVVHKPNGGLSSARMAGVEATGAEYIFALDADDKVAARSLSPLADQLDALPELQLVWGDMQTFGDWSQTNRMTESLDPWLITYMNEMPVAVLIRREALLAAGGWQLATGWEDWDLWQTLAERGALGRCVAGVCLLYRRHGTRMSNDAEARRTELMKVLRTRHPDLYASRRAAWRHSSSPLLLRLTLPVIRVLPFGRWARTRLSWLVGDLALGRPVLAPIRRSLSSLARRSGRRRRAGEDGGKTP